MQKIIGKIFSIIILFLLIFSSITISAEEVRIKEYGSDNYLIYEGTNEYITINSEYNYEETQFRGLWVSNFAGDISSYTTEAAFKKEMTTLLDTMEYYHLNALIFHVRTHNNALYNSQLNPKASYWTRVNFDSFDPLEWLITETHKRGIEFHAWMNPYRVKSSNRTYITGSFPSINPASNSDNLLSNSSTTILDPGKEAVKSFLVNTCLEFVNRYDVDAIHFDDYFYISDCDDTKTYNENNPNGLSKADWRRNNVDEFIRRLSVQLKRYNENNNKCVQLGIAPGGTWKNGNGKVTYDSNGTAITTGSVGNSGGSYGDSLYADTKKWVDNEWIDYICPQCYHDIQNGLFCELTDWWNSVCKYKKTNLYIGLGFYGPGSHWQDPLELKNEMYWMNKLEYVQGFSLYAYSALKKAYNRTNNLKATQVDLIYDDVFKNDVLLPVLRRYDYEVIDEVSNLLLFFNENYKITFDYNELVKMYVVYKDSIDKDNIIYQGSGEIDLINNKVEIELKESNFDKLIVIPINYTNVLGKGSQITKEEVSHKITFIYEDEIIKEIYTKENSVDEPIFDFDYDNYDVVLSQELDNISSDLIVYVSLVEKTKYINVIYLVDGKEVNEEFELTDKFPIDILDNIPEVLGKNINGLTEISEYLYKVEYSDIYYNVKFIGYNDELLLETLVLYGSNIDYPKVDDISGYYFVEWDYNDIISCDTIIHAIYQKYNVLTILDNNNQEVNRKECKDNELVDLKELINILDGSSVKFYIEDVECGEEIEIDKDTTVRYEIINNNIDNPSQNSGCMDNSIVSIYALLFSLSMAIVFFIFRRRL